MGAFLSLGLLNVLWMLPIGLFLVFTADDHGMFPYLKSAGKFMVVISVIIILIAIPAILS